jgi:hypothetical protein
MENSKSWQRSERVQIIPDQMIHDLEDKQLDLSYRDYQKTLRLIQEKTFLADDSELRRFLADPSPLAVF